MIDFVINNLLRNEKHYTEENLADVSAILNKIHLSEQWIYYPVANEIKQIAKILAPSSGLITPPSLLLKDTNNTIYTYLEGHVFLLNTTAKKDSNGWRISPTSIKKSTTTWAKSENVNICVLDPLQNKQIYLETEYFSASYFTAKERSANTHSGVINILKEEGTTANIYFQEKKFECEIKLVRHSVRGSDTLMAFQVETKNPQYKEMYNKLLEKHKNSESLKMTNNYIEKLAK